MLKKISKILKNFGKTAFVQGTIGYIFYLYSIVVYKTSRWTIEGWPEDMAGDGSSFLFAFWHGRLMTGTFLFFNKKIKMNCYVLTSLHRDGRAIAAAMGHFGAKVIGGSSKRGGVGAALGIIKTLKQDSVLMAMAPDGRKPGYKMTKGLVSLAKESRRPIFLSSFSVKRGKIFKTWDRFLLPRPFNTGIVKVSGPIYIPADLDDEGIEAWRRELEHRLIELTAETDRRVGLKTDGFLQKEGN